MALQLLKASTSDALTLNCISKQAFDSDVEVGAPSAGGPPGYMSLKYHMKMARMKCLYKLTDNGLIVGGAILFPDGDTLNIGRIFISPEHFHKGYGVFMMQEIEGMFPEAKVNPLGEWTGGTDVDTGATNRKLGSDMADSVTGGGLHGKDLSKADVSVNIYAWLKAQRTGEPVELCCAIGDDTIDGLPYSEIVETARDYIRVIGGFEKFAEWGLVR